MTRKRPQGFAAAVKKMRREIDIVRRDGRSLSRLRLRTVPGESVKKGGFHNLAFRMLNGMEAESVQSDGRRQPVAIVYGVSACELAELGQRLLLIFEDRYSAEEIFELPKRRRGKPEDRRKYFMLFEYWSRVVDCPTSASEIAKEVAANYGKSPATVTRLARLHREHFLRLIGEQRDVSAARSHLAKKSKGGNRAK